jgi:hypothetical protein
MASLRSSQQRILKRLWSSSLSAAAASSTRTVSARQAVTPSSSVPRQHPWHPQQQAQRQFFNSSSYLPWQIRRPEKGTGFDNFLPKEKEADESKEDATKEQQGQQSSSGGGNSGNNKKNNNNNPNDFNSIITLILTVLIGLTVASNLDSGRNRQQQDGAIRGGAMGGDNDQLTLDHAAMAVDDADASLSDLVHHRRIITWNEFLRLLRHRQIQRIVISSDQQSAGGGNSNSNNNHAAHARVYVKQRLVDHPADQHHDQNSGGILTHDDQHAAGGQLIGVAHSSSSSNPAFYYRMPIGSIDAFERKLEDAQKSLGYGVGQNIPVQYTAPNTAVREVMGIVPGVLIALALYGMLRFGTRTATGAGGGGGIGGIFQFGKSTHKRIKKEDIKVTFADVAGCDEAKKEIMEFVDFLKDAERFTTLGAKIPKGALLCGPPGTYRPSCVYLLNRRWMLSEVFLVHEC